MLETIRSIIEITIAMVLGGMIAVAIGAAVFSYSRKKLSPRSHSVGSPGTSISPKPGARVILEKDVFARCEVHKMGCRATQSVLMGTWWYEVCDDYEQEELEKFHKEECKIWAQRD